MAKALADFCVEHIYGNAAAKVEIYPSCEWTTAIAYDGRPQGGAWARVFYSDQVIDEGVGSEDVWLPPGLKIPGEWPDPPEASREQPPAT